MLIFDAKAPGGTVSVGLRYPLAPSTVHPEGPQGVAQPVDGVQISVGLLQTAAAPPQTPPVQTSFVVQTFPSSHDVPSVTLTIAGHRGGPPPCIQLFDSSI